MLSVGRFLQCCESVSGQGNHNISTDLLPSSGLARQILVLGGPMGGQGSNNGRQLACDSGEEYKVKLNNVFTSFGASKICGDILKCK